MVKSVSVKHFLHSDTGAPTLTGAPGSIAALLYACLVTGYNASAVDSITRSRTTVTVTVSAGHGLKAGSVVKIANADQAEYNGCHRITTATANTLEFELEAGVEPVTPATGTIDCCQAPAGWERPSVSGDAQRMAFKSAAVDATGMTIYIDDSNNQGTRRTGVKGYESMTDIDTGVNPFPYSAADDQWLWWYKSADETTPLRWAVVADDKLVYIWWNRDSGASEDFSRLNAFGDIISQVPADAWHCLVTGEWSATDETYLPVLASVPYHQTGISIGMQGSGVYLARDYLGTACAGVSGAVAPVAVENNSNFLLATPIPLGSGGVDFPSPATGGAVLAPVFLEEALDFSIVLRGQNPGMYAPYHNQPYSKTDPEMVSGSGAFSDRRFMALPFRGGRLAMMGLMSAPSNNGQVLLDVVGPWRQVQ